MAAVSRPSLGKKRKSKPLSELTGMDLKIAVYEEMYSLLTSEEKMSVLKKYPHLELTKTADQKDILKSWSKFEKIAATALKFGIKQKKKSALKATSSKWS